MTGATGAMEARTFDNRITGAAIGRFGAAFDNRNRENNPNFLKIKAYALADTVWKNDLRLSEEEEMKDELMEKLMLTNKGKRHFLEMYHERMREYTLHTL